MPTFAEEQVTRIQTVLAENVGVSVVTVNGRSVTYEKLESELAKWESRVARENGTRPRAAKIDLSGF